MVKANPDRILVPPSTADPVALAAAPRSALPGRLQADPERVEAGLARLVLTLVELIRQLLEREAIRRLDRGTLSLAEVERLGTSFMLLQEKLVELRELFGLSEEDLNLDLGPLGRVL